MSYVLVVEDDALAASAARDLLAGFGHHVRVVPSPATAVKELLWKRPLVVLTDRCLRQTDTRALQGVCDSLAILLLDLPGALCLMSRRERRPVAGPPTPERLSGSRFQVSG